MGKLFNLLSEKDKKTFENYVNSYSYTKNNIGIEKMLYDWDVNKRKLYQLLGNQFIYSFPYTIKKSEEEFRKEIRELSLNSFFSNLENNFIKILIAAKRSTYWHDALAEKEFWNLQKDLSEEEICFFQRLIKSADCSDQPLVRKMSIIKKLVLTPYVYTPLDNKISFKDMLPEEIKSISLTIDEKLNEDTIVKKKVYTLKEGEKWTKALYNLAVFLNKYFPSIYPNFDKNEYDSFCLQYSKILQNNKESGIMYLSIHPMDFATMSDNANGWTSCMNWQKNGCYRTGSYELMSSNNVILCYTVSNKNLVKIRPNVQAKKFFSDFNEWNSKTWRTFVVINNKCIISGKHYPNTSVDKVEICLEKLRELAETNLKWNYNNKPIKKYNSHNSNITLKTHFMYNDFFEAGEYSGYRIINNSDLSKKYSFCFSGKIRCLDCGKVLSNRYVYEDEDFRCKKCCDKSAADTKGMKKCSFCNNLVNSENLLKLDNKTKDYYICCSCFGNREENDFKEFITNEEYPTDVLIPIYYITNKNDFEDFQKLYNQLMDDLKIKNPHNTFINLGKISSNLYRNYSKIINMYFDKNQSVKKILISKNFYFQYLNNEKHILPVYARYFSSRLFKDDFSITESMITFEFLQDNRIFYDSAIFFSQPFLNNSSLRNFLLEIQKA